MEVVVSYCQKYVFQKKEDINVKAFNMITTKTKLKEWQNVFDVIGNAKSIVQYVIQIKNGIMNYGNVRVKIAVSAKMIIVGILAHVFVGTEKESLILQGSRVRKLYLLWILYHQHWQII